MTLPFLRVGALVAVGTCMLVVACSSSKTADTPSTTTSTAAAVMGATDSHCAGKPVVVVDPAVCHVTPDAGEPAEAGADAGMMGDVSDYGPTNYNSEGDDDDCKYHVKWESTAVAQNTDVTFKVTVTNKKDGSPVAGDAKLYAEVFLDDKTPAPNSPSGPSVSAETSPGVYTVNNIRFDKPGNWNARFHFHAECNDSEESPHGHAAFFVKVP